MKRVVGERISMVDWKAFAKENTTMTNRNEIPEIGHNHGVCRENNHPSLDMLFWSTGDYKTVNQSSSPNTK